MDPNTQRIALGAAGAGGQTEYWHDKLLYANASFGQIENFGYVWNEGTYIDADNNIYQVGQTYQSPRKAFILKRDADGVIQWARILSHASAILNYTDIVSDGTYLYVSGSTQGFRSSLSALLVVYDLNGNLQSQQDYQLSGTSYVFNFLKIDSSGNLYAGSGLSGNKASCIKLNSSLNVQWCTGIGYNYGVSSGSFFHGMTIDSSGNPIITFKTSTDFLIHGALIAKFNTSTGALLWSHVYSPATNIKNEIWAPVCDSNDNVYAVVKYNNTTPYWLTKWNSSGVLQSSVSTSTASLHQVYIDHDDNVWSFGEFGHDLLDTSLNWQFGRTTGNTPGYSTALRGPSSDGLYRLKSKSSGIGAEALFPIDGSLTGTYVGNNNTYTINYAAASTHTPTTAPTFNDLGNVVTTTPSSFTKGTTSFTDSADSNWSLVGRQYF